MFMVKYRMGKKWFLKKTSSICNLWFKKNVENGRCHFCFFPIFLLFKKTAFWRKKSYKKVIQSYNYVVRSKSISAQETIVGLDSHRIRALVTRTETRLQP